MSTIELGAQVKILPTGDPDIDRYIDKIGTIVNYECDWTGPDWDAGARRIVHFFVQMADGGKVCVGSEEFEVQRAE